MIYPRISNCVSENERALTPKDRLNKALNQKLDEVEIRKQRMVTLDKKIAKLPDGSEKRKLMYQKQQTEENNRKHKKSPIDEERNLHESYQILLRVSLWTLTSWAQCTTDIPIKLINSQINRYRPINRISKSDKSQYQIGIRLANYKGLYRLIGFGSKMSLI